ncbi:hypothetical protein FHY15_000314 [Xanthomonas arboricola]|nr:hypothetical protein [Xanthomonas arboricola]NJC02764.1 hypothetical protein [Xanthomonas arboricola]
MEPSGAPDRVYRGRFTTPENARGRVIVRLQRGRCDVRVPRPAPSACAWQGAQYSVSAGADKCALTVGAALAAMGLYR